MRAQAKLHAIAHPSVRNDNASQSLQDSFESPWRHILPRKETRLMSDEANKTSGLFIPYPLLGLLLTLTLALGGGIIALYAQVTTMNATIIMRDMDYQRQIKEQKDKLDQMEIYLHNDRERLAVLERDTNLQRKRN